MQNFKIAAIVVGTALSVLLTAGPALAQMRMSSPASPGKDTGGTRPGDTWTGGGILFAPRYLNNPGDLEVGVGPAYIINSAPGKVSPPIGGALGFEYKVTDSLEVALLLAPITLGGLRGPITENEFGSVGWSLLYRGDLYPAGVDATGKLPSTLPPGTTPFFLPFMQGAVMTHGGELRIDGMQRLGPVNLFAVPSLGVALNGTRVGIGLGADLDFDRVIFGLNWRAALNLTPPANPAGGSFNNFENQYGLGGRVVLNDNLYLLTNYFFVQADTYGNQAHIVLGGIGYRLAQGGGSGGGMRMSK